MEYGGYGTVCSVGVVIVAVAGLLATSSATARTS